MFFPTDLLSHRRRAKLAPCWLAAMSNERSFKRNYSSAAIKKMNIRETCDEILQAIHAHNNGAQKFSLYLSSQLMYGITKIFSYQVVNYEKEVLDIWQKLNFTTSSERVEKDLNMVEGAMELPLISNQRFLNAQLNKDLHLLPDENPNDRLQVLMQDATCLNFGALTNEELDIIHEHDGDISFEMRENMHVTDDNEEKDIANMMANIEIAEEIHQERLSSTTPHSLSMEKRADSKEKFLTVQKRQSHQPQIETPTKRRRLSIEDAATAACSATLKDVTVPVPGLSVPDIEVSVPSEEVELDMELESVHSSIFMIKKNPKKSKIIDKTIILEEKQLRQWRHDINAHCKQLDRPRIHHLIPATDLFNQPSHWPIQWNANLRKLFVNHTTRLLTDVKRDTSAGSLQSQKAMRAEEITSKLNLAMEELSAIGKTQAAITAVDSTLNILPTNEIEDAIERIRDLSVMPLEMAPDVIEEGINIERDRDQKKTADLSDNGASLEDIEILLKGEQHPLRTKDCISESSVPSTKTSQLAHLTKSEILALLEILWRDQQCVKFSELISKETYTRIDAADACNILLELQAEKVLVLQQSACYRTLWIRKYETYSD